MNFTRKTYINDMEILVTSANLVTFSGTVLSAGVVADAEGKKYVPAGSLIDVDGNVVVETGDAGAEALSTIPVGVLYQTVNVTDGDQPAALVVEGYLRKDRVIDGVFDNTIAAIKTALPNIKFR